MAEESGSEQKTEEAATAAPIAAEAATAETSAATLAPAPKRKKGKKNIPNGVVYINATFNNTLVMVTDTNGNAVSWSSAGSKGFRGSRKNTPFAAQVAAEEAVKKAVEHGMRSVTVEVRGPGAGRESALRAVYGAGVRVTQMQDTTPIPHNGCRPPKRRRV